MTGQGTIQTAVEAMKVGAFDYVLKPFNLQTMLPVLDRAMDGAAAAHGERPAAAVTSSGSPTSRRATSIDRVRPGDAAGGATDREGRPDRRDGAGPRRRAAPARNWSPGRCTATARAATGRWSRSTAPPCRRRCWRASCSATRRARSPGRSQAKPGLIEVAEGGTLFIDEVAEMAPALQAKLLRVLEDGHYRRVGGTQEQHADVRVVAATNKPLEDEQKAGRFREDLYYRLNVISITLPPLRERREDIPRARRALPEDPADREGPVRHRPRRRCGCCAGTTGRATSASWPTCWSGRRSWPKATTITTDDLPENLVQGAPAGGTPHRPRLGPDDLEGIERRHVEDVLRRHGGNKVQAAKALGVSRRTLYRLIEKYVLAAEGEGTQGTRPAE